MERDVARLRREQAGPCPVAVGGAGLGPLVAGGADGLGRLQLDELLGDQAEGFPGEVDAAARADGIEQVGQGRL